MNSWPKVCLAVKTSEELEALHKTASGLGVCSFLHSCEGQIAVCVVGPNVKTKIDLVTG